MERHAQASSQLLILGLLVCPTCPLTTLSSAISQAHPGEVITVQAGRYAETGIVIDKPLRLKGVGKPIVDAGEKGSVFTIRAPDVEISGFRIRNSGRSYIDDLAAIKVEKADRCILRGNQIENAFFAIHIGDSKGCVIEGNRIEGNASRGESASGNGIHLWHSEGVQIRDNYVTQQRDGIYFEFVTNSQIERNVSEGNLRYGLHFMYSNGNTYQSNIFRKNASGVAVMFSRGIRMLSNHFEESWGGAAYGILLKEITQSEIRGNLFRANTVGAYLDGTTRSQFEENEFEGNGWALRVLGDSDSNRFTHNNFISNTFDVSTNASSNQNTFLENYWSDYGGVDVNRDRIGDTPFHLVRLSSVLMEKFGVSVLLLKSFFFTVADEAEAALPVLTPDSFRDERPLMNRFTPGSPSP